MATITAEGKAASNRIKEFRQNVNNGATASQARKTVRALENPTEQNMQSANTANANNPNFVPFSSAKTTPIQPTVSANDLANPAPRVNLTTPPAPTIPERTGATVNNVLGSIRSTSENARRLQEEQAAFQSFVDGSSGFDIQNQQLERFGVTPEVLKELKDVELQLSDMNTASDLTKTRIANAPGQTLAAAQRELTQEDRENAVRSAGLAARAAVLQGNIETGRALANDAVNIAMQDRTFQANAKIMQINQLKDVVDEETRQLLEVEKRNYEAELAKIEEVKTNVANAMVNGATQSEMAMLNDPNMSDDDKIALAQSITARGANQMRNLEMAQKSASIRASNASAALNEAELVAYNKAQEDAANGILSPEQMKVANDVNKDFESQPIVKAYVEGLQSYSVLEETIKNGIDGIQDIQLVYNFMKSVDPTSVVRTEEFDTVASSGNIFKGSAARFNRYFGSGGILPEEVRQDLMRTARSAFEARNTQYYNVKSEYAKRMNNTVGTTNGADYLTAYEAAAPLTSADENVVFGLQQATPQDIQDIMLMTEQLSNPGTQGATIYK